MAAPNSSRPGGGPSAPRPAPLDGLRLVVGAALVGQRKLKGHKSGFRDIPGRAGDGERKVRSDSPLTTT